MSFGMNNSTFWHKRLAPYADPNTRLTSRKSDHFWVCAKLFHCFVQSFPCAAALLNKKLSKGQRQNSDGFVNIWNYSLETLKTKSSELPVLAFPRFAKQGYFQYRRKRPGDRLCPATEGTGRNRLTICILVAFVERRWESTFHNARRTLGISMCSITASALLKRIFVYHIFWSRQTHIDSQPHRLLK